jgi:hypothetical protein
MTTEPITEAMTEAEATAFVAKTQAWWNTLTTKEQAVLRQVLRPGAYLENGDVHGYCDIETYKGQIPVPPVWNLWHGIGFGGVIPLPVTTHAATPVPSGGGAPRSSGGTTYQN